MADSPKRDHWSHFVAYVLAGALMGGALDVFVFRLETPLYGVVGGAIIALAYVGILCLVSRARA